MASGAVAADPPNDTGVVQPGGPPGWGGTFRPDDVTAATRVADTDLQIELPYDEIRHVTVTGTRPVLATQVLMSLAGRGPAPF